MIETTHPEQVAQIAPDRVAVHMADSGETLCYGELVADANRCAGVFTDLCDRRFQAGDWIAMAWASGNRDEALFPDPDTFRIDRKLISLGNGPQSLMLSIFSTP